MLRHLGVATLLVLSATFVGCLSSEPAGFDPAASDGESLRTLVMHRPLLSAEAAWTIYVDNNTAARVHVDEGDWKPIEDAESSGVWSTLNSHDRFQHGSGRERQGGNASIVTVGTEPTGRVSAGPEVFDPHQALFSSPPGRTYNLEPGHHHLVVQSHRSLANWTIEITATGAGGFRIEDMIEGGPFMKVLAYPGGDEWTETAAASIGLTGVAVVNTTITVDHPFNLLFVSGTALSQTRINGPMDCDMRLPYNHLHYLWNAPVGEYRISAELTPAVGGPPNALVRLIQLPGHEDVERNTRCDFG